MVNFNPFKPSLVIILGLLCNSCVEKYTIFEITDLTKEQRFTHFPPIHRGSLYKQQVTIKGQIQGCAKIVYFYGADWDTTYLANRSLWHRNTMTVQDSISWGANFEGKVKHDFFFIPGDAVKGKITIRIKTNY